METMMQDVRFSIRQLFKNKSFGLTAILSLALGIGATTAVFSVVYGVLMDPYPYKDANRMVHVELFDNTGRQMGLVSNTGPELSELKQAKCVDDIFMMNISTATLTSSKLFLRKSGPSFNQSRPIVMQSRSPLQQRRSTL